MKWIVKVICHCVSLDWTAPYKNDDTSLGVGSGFFINKNGYILTCAHVVDNAIKVWIVIPSEGKDKHEVSIESICYEKDIAILKTKKYINSDYCVFGNSDILKLGSNVKALGYPLAQDNLKITAGIFSGRQGRYLQTDASLNSGNSGGPLVDKKFRVVGVNTSGMSKSVAEGVGFASPINDFLNVFEYMLKHKITTEPSFYAEFNNSDKNLCEFYNSPPGYYIKSILPISPLYIAGVREGDILCSIDKYNIDTHGEINVPWNDDKINIKQLLPRFNFNVPIPISYFHEKLIHTHIIFDDKLKLNVHTIYPLYDKIDYEIFGGMIFMNLHLNHIDFFLESKMISNLLQLKDYIEQKNRLNNVIIIASLLTGSHISTMGLFTSGEIITHVNNIPVSTLDDLRNALLSTSKFIQFKSKNNTVAIIDFKTIVNEELYLAKQHKYKISPLYKAIANEMKKMIL